MRMLVESLKRLYHKGKLTIEDIRKRLDDGIITEEEYQYIVGVANNGTRQTNTNTESKY